MLRCVCVLQLKAPATLWLRSTSRHRATRPARLPPLGTVPCPRTHACGTHYSLMIHKALCLVTRTHAHTVAHPVRSERAARSRSSALTRALCARASHRIGTRCHGVAPLGGQPRHCSQYEGSRRSCRWGSDRRMLSSKDEGRLPSASTCTSGTQAAAVLKGLPCSERSSEWRLTGQKPGHWPGQVQV